ncbi:Deoxyribodipyrimidine photo-lyase-related protein [Maioricimonas rarisocia]|uniref:Deoxyribodipyrimidine photo-lyase-related protein n=1 Tax=Maioricimonas rarisocia TaxID=2528026 RepID=A0A517Z8U5_9PLAN|nr:cryptochrome/photolyase family protein [Maioricimonas rarisocia]QDU38876.1 Deoxyribodipyrimidine photo-lyase-related protein [Maioricimonas rarisocia]
MRHLILVLGDQLNHDSAAFDGIDDDQDSVWMAEVHEEATHVWSHKTRLVLFFSAMRHFRDELRERGRTVHYHALGSNPNADRGKSFSEVLASDLERMQPQRLVAVLPGDFRVKQQFEAFANERDLELEWRTDRHFHSSPEDFAEFADGRKSLQMETFYRQMRRRHNVLMNGDDPVGGAWNLDHDNRESFGRDGPGKITGPHSFRPDEITGEVMDLVRKRFADHPGTLDDFDLPVTHAQARTMLRDFIRRQLPLFGTYEDAMWTDEPFLYHSRLSAALNLKLLDPRDCVELAVQAYKEGDAPLNSVEGFVRQILGWREFIRGIYWHFMPDYIERNHFEHHHDVPGCFWTGETEMACVRQSMQHVLQHAYAHHIHRLMVFGNLSLLLGVHPRKFHDWHMSMYADAIDWVSLPNTLGMSQHGDGGIVGTKPYVSSGNYINKMSNFCSGCRYDYKSATGEDACPFTSLYWDFLARHEKSLDSNHRMGMQLRNLKRKRDKGELNAIRERAGEIRDALLGKKP